MNLIHFGFWQICLITLLYAPARVNADVEIDDRVIGGKPAKRGKVPYQALIIQFISSSDTRVCGGALISNKWVITAAHCLPERAKIQVKLGGVKFEDTNEPGQVIMNAKNVYTHPSFIKDISRNDIGLVELPEKVKSSGTIKPIDLPRRKHSSDTLEGKKGKISGWGRTSDNSDLSDTLYYAKVKVVSNKNCRNPPAHETIICVIGKNNANACRGDRGGPLVVDKRVVGVLSFARFPGCADGIPSGYTRVVKYLDWISQVTGISTKSTQESGEF